MIVIEPRDGKGIQYSETRPCRVVLGAGWPCIAAFVYTPSEFILEQPRNSCTLLKINAAPAHGPAAGREQRMYGDSLRPASQQPVLSPWTPQTRNKRCPEVSYTWAGCVSLACSPPTCDALEHDVMGAGGDGDKFQTRAVNGKILENFESYSSTGLRGNGRGGALLDFSVTESENHPAGCLSSHLLSPPCPSSRLHLMVPFDNLCFCA